MTDGLDQAIANAGIALLRADLGPPPLVVFDGFVSAGTDVLAGYIVAYTYVSRPSDDPDNPASGRSGVWLARWVLHCVAGTASASRAVAQRARTQLLDVRPVIAGLSCGLIRLEDSSPPQRDETTGSLVMDTVQTFSLRATS